MSEHMNLNDCMKEDALIFDKISTAICNSENTNYELLLKECKNFENSVVLFNIVPSYYVMKTILCFKLNDYETAHKYINGSLKYLLYVAKNSSEMSEDEDKNFDEYKSNVVDQYKILLQEKPEYFNVKSAILPATVRFITTNDEALINEELKLRVLLRQK